MDAEINKYKTEVEQVTRSAGVNSLEEMDPNDFASGTKNLSYAIKQLPELTMRKNCLDMHMNIATALFKAIQTRQLDSFFRMEEAINKLTKPAILEIIRDQSKDKEDKIRLFIIFFLSRDDVPDEDITEFTQALKEAGCETAALEYAKT